MRAIAIAIAIAITIAARGADHALYVFDRRTAKKKRRLYSKAHGHVEWVTAVAHVGGGGDVASAGMDGKARGEAVCGVCRGLCVWASTRSSAG